MSLTVKECDPELEGGSRVVNVPVLQTSGPSEVLDLESTHKIYPEFVIFIGTTFGPKSMTQ